MKKTKPYQNEENTDESQDGRLKNGVETNIHSDIFRFRKAFHQHKLQW